MRNKVFKPQYLLVFGRRSEYENSEKLTRMRAMLREDDIEIASFDRLKPLADYRQFVTCTVKDKEYYVKNIPPTFRYRPDCVDSLYMYRGFLEQIDNMKNTSTERKDFLRKRYDYWTGFKGKMQGVMIGMEGE